jgi:diguanylate cyclase (GGDEF)-like protein
MMAMGETGTRIFLKEDDCSLLIIAEPERLSPSPFLYDAGGFTVGFISDYAAIQSVLVSLKINCAANKEKPASGTTSPAIKVLRYAKKTAGLSLERRCLSAARWDASLDNEGPVFFESLGARLQKLFAPEQVEIHPIAPSVYWSERPEGWSWVHSSRLDYQWPVSLSTHLERDLYRGGTPRIIEDASNSPDIHQATPSGVSGLNSGLLIPLIYRGRRSGLIKMFYTRPLLPLEHDVTAIQLFQEEFSRLFERSGEYLRTQRMAMVDGLTDLFNYRFFLTQLRNEFHRAARYGSVVSLIMVDVDSFKEFNDSYGHLAGDRALVRVAKTIRNSVRDIDFVSRYGGEEFALILPEVNADNGVVVAEKIRKAVSEIVFIDDGDQAGYLTVSCGVTDNIKVASPEEMIRSADEALYWVKRNGRNLVRLAARS